MSLPPFIAAFPGIALPLPEEAVSTSAMRTEQGLAVFFTVHRDITLPPHSHGDQWGTVLAGALALTRDGQTRVYRPGESYFIPAGQEHAASIPAGSVVFDVFAEPDRYPLQV